MPRASAVALDGCDQIESVAPGQVRVTQVADVHGLLAPLFGLALGSRVQSSHDALNAALKARAEASP